MLPQRTALDSLRRDVALAPAFVPGALALIPLVFLAADNGGYFPTSWYPGALFLCALAYVAVLALPRGPRPPRAVTVAAFALAAFAAWSYLTIAWADQRADAWDGANRTALYAALFGLFALWPLRARPAAVLVGAFVLGVAGIGLVELVRMAAADDPGGYFLENQLSEPLGYTNGNAALWTMAFFPALVLASRREVPPALRAAFAGSAVLLIDLAVMCQSRGWFFALPAAVAIYLAVTPKRVRATLTLLLVLAGAGAAAPAVLGVYDEEGPLGPAVDSAASALIPAAVIVAVIAGLAALADRRRTVSLATERRAGRVLAVAVAGAVVLGSVAYVAERGNPFTDIGDAWAEFKTKPTPSGGSSRLTAGLGSNRYDFWRVAWGRFESAPIAGIGADNFQQAYLARSRSHEEPRYPHSVELRALSQTGLIGTGLLAVAIGGALAGAWRAIRLRTGVGTAAAAAGVSAFAYWFVHGSVDWFWEFPALGGAAFALLGLAAGLAPRHPEPRPALRRRPLAPAAGLPVAAVLALAMAYSFGAPWLSERNVDKAAEIWPEEPQAAFDRLDSAASLNRLSAKPDLVAGSIALRLDDLGRAESSFRKAIEREPGDAYGHLELGAILVNDGRRAEGTRLLARARELHPRDAHAASALRRARRGQRIDIARMNEAIARRARELGQ